MSFLSKRIRFSIVACALATAASPPSAAQGSGAGPLEPTVGGVLWDTVRENLGAALSEANRARANLAQANQEIAEARRRFWAAFPDKPGFAAAEQEFSRQLWAKDLFFLSVALPEGVDGRAARIVNSLVGRFDGGIRPNAYSAFQSLVTQLRSSLGAQSRNDIVFIDALRLARAMEANRDRLLAYKRARDWAEFEASGLDQSRFFTPKDYALQLLGSRLSQVRWEAGTARPDPEQEVNRAYNAIVSAVGEPVVLAAAAKVSRAKKDARGDLMTPAPIAPKRGGESTTTDPYRWFEDLLAGDARGYAASMLRSIGYLPSSWETAAAEYRRLVAKYGEAAVLAAAEQVRQGPKSPWGTIGDQGWPREWFEKILADPNTNIPGPAPRLPVTDLAGLRAANGKTVVATGTISNVTTESGGGALVYYILHFRDVDSGVVTGQLMDRSVRRRFGPNGAGLVGKTVEITADFWLNPTGEITFRIPSLNQVKILSSSAPAPAYGPVARVSHPASPPPVQTVPDPRPSPAAPIRSIREVDRSLVENLLNAFVLQAITIEACAQGGSARIREDLKSFLAQAPDLAVSTLQQFDDRYAARVASGAISYAARTCGSTAHALALNKYLNAVANAKHYLLQEMSKPAK